MKRRAEETCGDFRRGDCSRGDRCKFSHDLGGGGQDVQGSREAKRFHSADPGVPRTRHAFKVLIPDEMAASLLGKRGGVKDEIQTQTGTKLIFSNRDDYFPSTRQRVLGIFSDDPEGIMKALESVLPKLIELGEDERREGKGKGKSDEGLLGKENGEYIFRLCITAPIAGLLIGSGGGNIKGLRQDSGAKVFIDNDSLQGHRLVRVIGLEQNIMRALSGLNRYVQQECDTEDFFSEYASVINFGASASSYREDENHFRGGGGNDGERSGRDWPDRRDRGGKRGGKGEDDHIPAPAARGVSEGLDLLADAVIDMSSCHDGAAELKYALSCEVPESMVEALQSYTEQVAEEAHVDIEFGDTADPNTRVLTCTGPMPWVYAGITLFLQRLSSLRAEAEAGPAEKEEDPEALRRQIAELQAKLKRAKG